MMRYILAASVLALVSINVRGADIGSAGDIPAFAGGSGLAAGACDCGPGCECVGPCDCGFIQFRKSRSSGSACANGSCASGASVVPGSLESFAPREISGDPAKGVTCADGVCRPASGVQVAGYVVSAGPPVESTPSFAQAGRSSSGRVFGQPVRNLLRKLFGGCR